MRRAAFLSLVLFSLTACADNNPIEWGKTAAREVGNMFGGETPPEAEPPAAEGRPFPNLATVPRRPRDPPEAKAQREADFARLTRDRDRALSDDETLRTTGAMPPPEVKEEAAKEIESAPVPPPAVTPPAAAVTPPPSSAPAVPAPSPSVAAVPPSAAASPVAAAPAAVSAQRVGAVSFARDAATLTATAQRSLAEAATLARPNNGRVRLVAAQTARQAASVDLASARVDAITRALVASGIPAARVTIDEALGRRVDLYDVYVER